MEGEKLVKQYEVVIALDKRTWRRHRKAILKAIAETLCGTEGRTEIRVEREWPIRPRVGPKPVGRGERTG